MAATPSNEFPIETVFESGACEITLRFRDPNTMPVGVLRKSRNADQLEQLFQIFEWGLHPDDLEQLDKLTVDELFAVNKQLGDTAAEDSDEPESDESE